MRFILRDIPPEAYDDDESTKWWDDTDRPLKEGGFVAVQTYADKDPNSFVRIPSGMMCLLFTDEAEYYAVCPSCRAAHSHQQWSGSTRGLRNWRNQAERYLERHEKTKGWCEFCDPVFGNGGWSMSHSY